MKYNMSSGLRGTSVEGKGQLGVGKLVKEQ